MKDYIIKKARLVDGSVVDIIVEDGIIKEIGTELKSALKPISFGNDYVSAGWIDIHTHCFDKFEMYGDKVDLVGYPTGVCSVIDAGTAGSDTIDEFYQQAKDAKTRVFSMLNIACKGIYAQNELADLGNLKKNEILAACKKYPDFIVGIKARMSKSVLGDSGNQPLLFGKEVSQELQLPLMVHIGSAPSLLEDVINILGKNDIITHIFNPKVNGIIKDQQIKDCVFEAIKKGIYLDLGHGTDSFSFEVAKCALENNILVDSISSDIYFRNRINGPVYDLVTTMNKLLYVGYSLEKIIDSVTTKPAAMMHLNNLGAIAVGKIADFTSFRVVDEALELVDSTGVKVVSNQMIKVSKVIVKNHLYDLQGDK